MSVRFNDEYLKKFIGEGEYTAALPALKAADSALMSKTGPGNDFLGWLTLPSDYDREEFARIKRAGEKIRSDSDVLVVIGIGGSYLGARAALELLRGQNYNITAKPQIFFAGNNISSSYLCELLDICRDKRLSINVVSKSGTTTEPAIAYRAFAGLMKEKYGDEAASRTYMTTDKSRGTLKKLADSMGCQTFVIPDNIGGRYSVLTACGLLTMAVAGIDIDAVMSGAKAAMDELCGCELDSNPCYKYAVTRNLLLRKGKTTEMLVGFEPDFTMSVEWFKQLFGESEGKDNKGIFPAGAIFSTDLHSMGQYIQQGMRNLFETVVWFNKPKAEYVIANAADDSDGLNYIAGKGVSYVNSMAMKGTMLAHNDGGVPCAVLEFDEINEFNYGYMVYFFEKACAISGYLLGVNPFDQPGVEFYKKNMFKLLGKPGF